MWVILNDSFISAVQHFNDENKLMIRARKKEHLTVVFPDEEVYQDLPSDYPYRVVVSKEKFAKVLADEVERIDYHNFKSSISKANDDLYKFASEAWGSSIRNFEGWEEWKEHAPASYFAKPKKKKDKDKSK